MDASPGCVRTSAAGGSRRRGHRPPRPAAAVGAPASLPHPPHRRRGHRQRRHRSQPGPGGRAARCWPSTRSPEALAVAARERRAPRAWPDWSTFQAGRPARRAWPTGVLRLVVSNPPYVRAAEYRGAGAGRPRCSSRPTALDGRPGRPGRRTAGCCPRRPGRSGRAARCFLEVGDGQAEAVADLAREAGFAARRTSQGPVRQGPHRAGRPSRGAGPARWTGWRPADAGRAGRGAPAPGAVIGVPTDTVYGLAAAWDSAAGVRAPVRGQGPGRGAAGGGALPVGGGRSRGAARPGARGRRGCSRRCCPGPTRSWCRPRCPGPPLVGTADSLGVRVPTSPRCFASWPRLGVPLAATSANLTGRPDAGSLADVEPALLAHAAAAFAPPDLGHRAPAGARIGSPGCGRPARSPPPWSTCGRWQAGVRRSSCGKGRSVPRRPWPPSRRLWPGAKERQPGPGSARSDVVG